MTQEFNSEHGHLSTQLQKIIIKKIEQGEYLPGEKLYSERAMAEMYGLSRMTVQYALNELEKKGYVYRIRGKGTFVQKNLVDKMDLGYLTEQGNTGITAIARNYGAKISNKVLAAGIISGNFFDYKLSLRKASPIYALHRIRYGNDEPIAVEYTYVPADLFEDIEDVDFGTVSLYDYMHSKGHMPVKFKQKLQIINVMEKERHHLDLDSKEPVYYFEFIGYDHKKQIVEYTESYARCDKFDFKFDATV